MKIVLKNNGIWREERMKAAETLLSMKDVGQSR